MILRWIGIIGGILLFTIFVFTVAAPDPEKSEPELCDGLDDLQCFQAKALERRRNAAARAWEAANE